MRILTEGLNKETEDIPFNEVSMAFIPKSILLCFLIASLTIVTSAQEDPKMNISLLKTQYTADQPLEGEILLTFKKQTENKPLEIVFGTTSQKRDLLSLLDDLDKAVNASTKTIALLSTESDISFPPLEQTIGFSAESSTKTADVDGTSVLIGASTTSFPTFPSMDIGADGIAEWRWLGSITSQSTFKGSSELRTEETGSRTIQSSNNYVCELIYIPH